MAENGLKERMKGYSGKAEDAINKKVKGIGISWGYIIIIGGMIWALVHVFKFFTMFFK